LILGYFLALTGALGTIYWIPTFVKRLSGFSNQTVTSLLLIPAVMGIAGMLINGWDSDRTAERHWHSAIPLVATGFIEASTSTIGGFNAASAATGDLVTSQLSQCVAPTLQNKFMRIPKQPRYLVTGCGFVPARVTTTLHAIASIRSS
jgi:predicted MFS family arabinose efflux permease